MRCADTVLLLTIVTNLQQFTCSGADGVQHHCAHEWCPAVELLQPVMQYSGRADDNKYRTGCALWGCSGLPGVLVVQQREGAEVRAHLGRLTQTCNNKQTKTS